MRIDKMLFNSITASMPKNMIQFASGVVLFWLIIGTLDISAAILAMVAFVVTYSSVYMYNDILDYKVDKKDEEKLKWKLIASGDLSVKKAKYLTIFFVVVGLSISLFVNRWFLLMMITLLFLNFLHSSPKTRFRKSVMKTSINMTVIEFLKYSTGWFALTSNISQFPFWLVLSISFIYTTGYMLYKFRFKGSEIRSKKTLFWIFGAISGFSYGISIFLYGFPLSLLILITIAASIFVFFRHVKLVSYRTKNMMFVGYILLLIFMTSFLILMVPVVAEINDNIANEIQTQMEKFSDSMPKNIYTMKDPLRKYETLDEIEEEIKTNFKNITEALTG